MSVNQRLPIAVLMLTALTQLAALNAPAKVDLKEMESIAQVSPTVRNVIIIFSKCLINLSILHYINLM